MWEPSTWSARRSSLSTPTMLRLVLSLTSEIALKFSQWQMVGFSHIAILIIYVSFGLRLTAVRSGSVVLENVSHPILGCGLWLLCLTTVGSGQMILEEKAV